MPDDVADLCRCQVTFASGERCANVPSYVATNRPREGESHRETSVCQQCMGLRSEEAKREAHLTVRFTMIEPQYEVLIPSQTNRDGLEEKSSCRVVGTMEEIAHEIAQTHHGLSDDAQVRLRVPVSLERRTILATMVRDEAAGLEAKNRVRQACLTAERQADKALDLLSICDDPSLRAGLERYALAMTARASEARAEAERRAG